MTEVLAIDNDVGLPKGAVELRVVNVRNPSIFPKRIVIVVFTSVAHAARGGGIGVEGLDLWDDRKMVELLVWFLVWAEARVATMCAARESRIFAGIEHARVNAHIVFDEGEAT